jgi:choline dehydrogenase-like flavoprotein
MYTPNWLPYDTSRDFLRGYQVQTMLGIPSQDQDKTSWSMNCFGEILSLYENDVRSTGLEIERVIEEVAAPGSSIHEVGTARRGHDAKTSVVDAFNRVHGCPNVLVVDGACWPSAGYQNPTLTMVAMAARACDTYLQSVAAGH